jgi:hypothetical protein
VAAGPKSAGSFTKAVLLALKARQAQAEAQYSEGNLAKRAVQMAQSTARNAYQAKSGFAAAIIWTFIRLVLLLGVVLGGFLYFYADAEGVTDLEFGDIVRYALHNLFNVQVRAADDDVAAATIAMPFFAAAGLTIYFLPAINAARRQHPHYNKILFLNMALGWTAAVWLICLLWSALTFGDRAPAPAPAAHAPMPQPAAAAGPWAKAAAAARPAALSIASGRLHARAVPLPNRDIVMRTRPLPIFWRRAR